MLKLSGALLLLLFATLGPFSTLAENNKIIIFSTIEPITYLTEKIGGQYIEGLTLMGKGKDPHTFSPTPQQIIALSKAQIYFTINLPFEQAINKRLSDIKNLKVVNLAPEISSDKKDDHLDHQEHHDPHIWLSIKNLRYMSFMVAKTLSAAIPQHQTCFADNRQKFVEELEINNKKIKKILAPHEGKSILVFHPAFEHFLNEYNLKQIAIEQHSKIPSPKQLGDVIKTVKEKHIKVIFIQPQFDQRAAKTIAQAINGKIIQIDALEKDIIKNLLDMATMIDNILQH